MYYTNNLPEKTLLLDKPLIIEDGKVVSKYFFLIVVKTWSHLLEVQTVESDAFCSKRDKYNSLQHLEFMCHCPINVTPYFIHLLWDYANWLLIKLL